ncbi:hypothetical protein [Paenibacillus turpanensis]|uniref:hypothetical protein n=1 Tax=Paenibacillus turpanensis TaxID=2689078 RepID=UPI00140A5117|nr:hypothetical protein [Paenibacillus turpanensis]
MKKLLLRGTIVVSLFTLFGCQHSIVPSDNPMLEKSIEVASLSSVVETNQDKERFVEPEPSEWVEYSKLVREYMYHRTQAVLHKDIDILWSKYPELKENMDRETGVNVEKYDVEYFSRFGLQDANFDIEGYEKIKVSTINDNEKIVLVHGSIVYLKTDFDEAGGEYVIKVFLQKKDQQWTVVKTDEYTIPEYKEWLKQKNS